MTVNGELERMWKKPTSVYYPKICLGIQKNTKASAGLSASGAKN